MNDARTKEPPTDGARAALHGTAMHSCCILHSQGREGQAYRWVLHRHQQDDGAPQDGRELKHDDSQHEFNPHPKKNGARRRSKDI